MHFASNNNPTLLPSWRAEVADHATPFGSPISDACCKQPAGGKDNASESDALSLPPALFLDMRARS